MQRFNIQCKGLNFGGQVGELAELEQGLMRDFCHSGEKQELRT